MALWTRRISSRPSRSAPSGYPLAFSPVLAVALVLLVSISVAGCDSFSTGRSGLSFTPNKEVVTAADSTVSLTFTNQTDATIGVDFVCGLTVQGRVDGEWQRTELLNPVCARISPVASQAQGKASAEANPWRSAQEKSYIGLSPNIRPGASRSALVSLTPSMREATALRFRLLLAYPQGAFSPLDNPFIRSGTGTGAVPETTVGNTSDFFFGQNLETATIISDEIQVAP